MEVLKLEDLTDDQKEFLTEYVGLVKCDNYSKELDIRVYYNNFEYNEYSDREYTIQFEHDDNHYILYLYHRESECKDEWDHEETCLVKTVTPKTWDDIWNEYIEAKKTWKTALFGELQFNVWVKDEYNIPEKI